MKSKNKLMVSVAFILAAASVPAPASRIVRAEESLIIEEIMEADIAPDIDDGSDETLSGITSDIASSVAENDEVLIVEDISEQYPESEYSETADVIETEKTEINGTEIASVSEEESAQSESGSKTGSTENDYSYYITEETVSITYRLHRICFRNLYSVSY